MDPWAAKQSEDPAWRADQVEKKKIDASQKDIAPLSAAALSSESTESNFQPSMYNDILIRLHL